MSREVGGVVSEGSQYRKAFEHAPIGIFIAEMGNGQEYGQVVDANDALCELLGYERDELLGSAMTSSGTPTISTWRSTGCAS